MKTARQKERELIIDLHNKKKSSYDIADILGISQTKASFWIRRYRKTESLENMPRSGRPTPLTKNKLNSLSILIKTKVIEPKKAGITSKEVLQLIKQKTDRKYTLRHVQRLLHRMGFSLITPRISHIRKDVKAQEKFREVFKQQNSTHLRWVVKV